MATRSFTFGGRVVGWEAAEVMWRKALIGVGETARGGRGVKCGFARPSRYCKSLAVPKITSRFRRRLLFFGTSWDAAARRLRPFFWGSKSETIRTFRPTAEMKATSPLVDYWNLNSPIAGKCHCRCTYSLFPRPGVLLADGQQTKK